jgi:hypothetical protein
MTAMRNRYFVFYVHFLKTKISPILIVYTRRYWSIKGREAYDKYVNVSMSSQISYDNIKYIYTTLLIIRGTCYSVCRHQTGKSF